MSGPDVDDAQRSLTGEGRTRSQQLLQRLVELDLACDLVLSSPLVRARQTAELAVAAGLAPELELAAALARPAAAASAPASAPAKAVAQVAAKK